WFAHHHWHLGRTNSFAQDANDDERTKALFGELRCVVCQNQSIAESDADVAKDLRAIVREQIAAGKTDVQIKGFLVDRYGEFILLRPVFAWHTVGLWITPILFGLLAFFLIWHRFSSARRAVSDVLDPEEEAQLDAIMKRQD
ncbi:MAG: cytochrome c-type biogenesis protein, partial [Pseudomonadota bacterium]